MTTHQTSTQNTISAVHLRPHMSSQCNETTLTAYGDECDLVSHHTRLTFQIVNFVVICQIISVFGTGTNIINIVCFVKQGPKDAVNISLLGLTLADLLSLVTLIWHNVSVNPWIYESNMGFDSQSTVYLTAGIPHVGFTRVTCWVTAFIALERCLCVAMPMKIKTIFTTKFVTAVIILIYVIIFFGNTAPVYYCTRFAFQPHPTKPNTTWLGIAFTEDRTIVERYSFAINNCFLPFTSFTIISAATVVLVVKLKSKTKWRIKATAPEISDSISSRDLSVSKMVVMISTMFIICYAPVCVFFIGIIAVPKLSIDGMFGNVYSIMFSFAYIFESVNASFNMIIYYKVSSRYRQTFRQTFLRNSDKETSTPTSYIVRVKTI